MSQSFVLRSATLSLTMLLFGCGGAPPLPPGATPTPPAVEQGAFRLLIYSRTDGFRHASIGAGIAAVQNLGDANNFAVDATEDPEQFNPETLSQYEVVLFLNTTLNVLNDTQQEAFEGYIRNGGNFVGVHSAADTEHDWPFYGELVGAYFLTHPLVNQPGSLEIEDRLHPSVLHLPNPWDVPLEEFYSFSSNPRGQVRVLMNIDEASYLRQPNTSCDPRNPDFPQGVDGNMGDHPMAWCHDKFAGRAWYTALGHEAYLYSQPDYQRHLLGGILTAARRISASCAVNNTPNRPAYLPPELEPCQNLILPGGLTP